MGLMRPCVECGEPAEDTRCAEHTVSHRAVTRTPESRPSRRAGYTTAWDRLSKRARRLQPFCSDCGTRDDLTADHSPEAWRRHDAGKPVRLCDIDVVCRRCNSRRGPARPSAARSDPRGVPPAPGGGSQRGECEYRSHTPKGYPMEGGAA